jgi:hypothetical protein
MLRRCCGLSACASNCHDRLCAALQSRAIDDAQQSLLTQCTKKSLQYKLYNTMVAASTDLVVGSSEPAAHVLVVQHLHLKGEVLLEILEDHDQERQLDAKCFASFCWAGDVGGAHIGAYDLQH